MGETNGIGSIEEIDTGESILFLGSGFSTEAENLYREQMPTGRGLKKILCDDLGKQPDDYDLVGAADEYLSRQDLDLHKRLYNLFTSTKRSDSQIGIISQRWRRIYTTNYDDVVEAVLLSKKIPINSFTHDDKPPRKIPPNSIVHLHGVIRKLTRENLVRQLVLNEESYVRQHFEKSPWFEELKRDLSFARAVFFIGYSLADYHIAAVLLEDQNLKDKVHFITRAPADAAFVRRVRDHGTVHSIGMSGFLKLCEELPKPLPISSLHQLKGFEYLDPFSDRRALEQPTSMEIINLLTYGTFNYSRCVATLPAAEYVAPRREHVNGALQALELCKTLLVHSQLGNGKTIFVQILARDLTERGYTCLLVKRGAKFGPQEVEFINKISRPILIFDDYNVAIEVANLLSNLKDGTKFIVTVRTGIQEVRLHEIREKLLAPVHYLSVNDLSATEKDELSHLCSRGGTLVRDINHQIRRSGSFREVVLALYNHEGIRDKIRSDLGPLFSDPRVKDVVLVSHLLRFLGESPDLSLIRTFTSRDAYAELDTYREIANELFSLRDGKIDVRSAIFSEYVLQHFFETEDLTQAVYKVLTEAVQQVDDKRYRTIMSALMQVSRLREILRGRQNREEAILDLYKRLRRDVFINEEPLFWLQYLILMIDQDELRLAESFLETAYERARANRGFKTYQIDTQALRLLLLLEKRETGHEIRRFDQIIEKIELVNTMLSEESHRIYAVKVLENVLPFVNARVAHMQVPEKNSLVFQVLRLVRSIDGLPETVRTRFETSRVRVQLLEARDILTY